MCISVDKDYQIQGRSWVFVAGGPDNRGAVGAVNSTAEGTLGTPTNFLIEFLQISGIHLIVPGGGSAPPAATPLIRSIRYYPIVVETTVMFQDQVMKCSVQFTWLNTTLMNERKLTNSVHVDILTDTETEATCNDSSGYGPARKHRVNNVDSDER
jgi:hypothetical protein